MSELLKILRCGGDHHPTATAPFRGVNNLYLTSIRPFRAFCNLYSTFWESYCSFWDTFNISIVPFGTFCNLHSTFWNRFNISIATSGHFAIPISPFGNPIVPIGTFYNLHLIFLNFYCSVWEISDKMKSHLTFLSSF